MVDRSLEMGETGERPEVGKRCESDMWEGAEGLQTAVVPPKKQPRSGGVFLKRLLTEPSGGAMAWTQCRRYCG